MIKHYVRQIHLAAFALLFAGCAVVAQPAPQAPQGPEARLVPPSEQGAVGLCAAGGHSTQCTPKNDDATKLEWSFVAPEAVLYDSAHNAQGKHYAGPTWEADDGSKVVGEVKARADAPAADAIPWLLLNAKSTEGAGKFGSVTSIQRVATAGGKAPQAGCDQAHQDEEVRVPYTATYYFYTTR